MRLLWRPSTWVDVLAQAHGAVSDMLDDLAQRLRRAGA